MQCDPGCEAERIEQMIRHVLWSSSCAGIVVGVSGGVDSSLAAVLCTAALGKERVKGVLLPSEVTRKEDIRDARNLCTALGIPAVTVSIQPILDRYRETPGYLQNTYLEGNLTARIRMTLLYYLANREYRLVCGTSNRSEYLLGYCTKYGDNAADFQPILHLYKTEVYALARHLELPAAILDKPPSAGLWAGQTDEGELGLTYPVIDQALRALESNRWLASTDEEEKVLRLVESSRHKRSPPFSLLAGS
ncbi:MAG: NAD+ synthase [Methanomicrobiales archaeon]|nr:NAD+ synthase [Methanomicrobiales archaeon]